MPAIDTPPVIGAVAQHLLLENADVKIWQVDTAAGETFPHHYHNHDYVLFHLTSMLGAVYNAESDHDRIWRARLEWADGVPDETLGGWCYEHGVNYIPGSGFLSPGYLNLSDHPFVAALLEVKRPRRPDQEGVGYARSDALVGVPPRPGTVMLLENDRVRVHETVIEPGQSDPARPWLDSAVYVVDGSTLRVDDGAAGPNDLSPASHSGLWRPAGRYALTNVGGSVYRELSVELK